MSPNDLHWSLASTSLRTAQPRRQTIKTGAVAFFRHFSASRFCTPLHNGEFRRSIASARPFVHILSRVDPWKDAPLRVSKRTIDFFALSSDLVYLLFPRETQPPLTRDGIRLSRRDSPEHRRNRVGGSRRGPLPIRGGLSKVEQCEVNSEDDDHSIQFVTQYRGRKNL
jgi:hypothetical protein